MKPWIGFLAAWALWPALAFPAETNSASEQRIDKLEQRLDEMEKKYQAELKARDDEIARLRAMVEKRQSQAGTEPSPLQTLTPQPPPTSQPTETSPLDEIEAAKQAVLQDISKRQPSPETVRTPASFNPNIAVVGDFHGNISTNNDNPARNRFDLFSTELDFRAAVDPRADAVVILPVSRDVDDPLFFNESTASGKVDTSVDIEEAYLFLHDFGVKNLTAKLGRYHLRFGRWNVLHSHDWPTVDNALAVQSFLGKESLEDSGLSLSYVVPPKLIGNQYVEAIAEIISGEGSEDNPVLNNDAFVDGPALNTHVLWNFDVASDWNVELGGSWLTGKHNNRGDEDANLFGADLTIMHTDPTGRFNNQILQGELFYGLVDTSPQETQHALGAYVLAQQQLNRDWYVGTRLDWTQNALNDQQEIWGVSPYVSWYWSEFLRFRLEYQHRGGSSGVSDEDILWFQVTFIFGAHPPHPYWVHR